MKRNDSLQRFLLIFLVVALVFSSFSPFVHATETDKDPAMKTMSGAPEKVLLGKASTWKYLDDGSNQGTAWKAADFNDSSWKSGAAPLGYPVSEERPEFGSIKTIIGYGESSQNKHATSYFRTTFEVNDLSEIGNTGQIKAGIDDSVILYLNGQEIARYNLPKGDIPFNGYVQDYGLKDSQEGVYQTFELDQEQLKLLVQGTNVLAAEVHQDRPTSSDLFWDMEFITINQAPVDSSVYQTSYIAFAPGENESEYNFSWYSERTAQAGVVQYAKKSDMIGDLFPSDTAQTFTAKVADASTGFSAHKATITGVKNSSEYVYRLGDGKGAWTEASSFKTHGTDAYNFLFMGDPQIGSSGNVSSDSAGWENTLNKAYEKFPNTSFILSAGDQVETAGNETHYAGYFAPSLLKQLPTATTIGNHDTGGTLYKSHFNVPNESNTYGTTSAGGDYYFTRGDTLFMVLNTNNSNGAEHRAFMEETIAANPNAKWKVLMFHQSIYSAANHSQSSSILNLRKELVPIIDDLDIDVVLSGHDHSYVRTYQMKGDQPLKNQPVDGQGRIVNPTGSLFLTANSSSGSKFYNLKPDAEPYAAVRHQLRVPTFMNVSVTPTSIEFTTYRVDTMEVTDSYTIVKDPSIVMEEPTLKDVSLKASGTVMSSTPSDLYPDIQLEVTGKSEAGLGYNILYSDITYKTDKEGILSISQSGKVTVAKKPLSNEEVSVWAEVASGDKSFVTNKMKIKIIEHVEEILLNRASTWKYLDDGSDQGTAWREPEFNDENWKSGAAPLGYPVTENRPEFGSVKTIIGYGPNSQKKYPTSYFRTTFEVADLDAIGDRGYINFGIDDSVVLYLNGHEIGRFNLPVGEIPFDKYVEDYAGSNVANESQFETFRLDKSHLAYLVEGTNVLSAEVHQDRPSSSDVYWDMELVTTMNVIEEEPNPEPKTIELELGDTAKAVGAGDTIKIKNTNTIVQLPSDLPEGTTLRVKSVDYAAPGLVKAGEVYNFEFTFPNGFEDYSGNFVLTLGVNSDVKTADKVGLYHFNEEKAKWELVGGEAKDGKIIVTVTHFSAYGVFVPEENQPGQDPTPVNQNPGGQNPTPGNQNPGGQNTDIVKDNTNQVNKVGNKLPNTATPYYNWIFLGSILIIIALVWQQMERKRKVQQ
ncbi:metallophosphoesterase [Neobacillus niacini]|uniref:metallophosphoesterase n=1 Tax=Neobacillus niacini TaxID=86668 RepID=UPI003000938A